MRPTAIGAAVTVALALAGCSAAAPDSGADGDRIQIVASTNVYGDIARTIGGDAVQVTSVIDNPAQDPHSFEGSARVQLALSQADVVIENGGGYDDWLQQLLAGADNDRAAVLNVTAISGFQTGPRFNEHLWYDFATVSKLAERLAEQIIALEPTHRDDVEARLAAFNAEIDDLRMRAQRLAENNDPRVAITEPVSGHLLADCGFTVVSDPEFSEAIESGADVPPTLLRDTLALFADGGVDLLVYNEQTAGPQTEAVLRAAKESGTPVVSVTETLPRGEHYVGWMSANLDALAEAA